MIKNIIYLNGKYVPLKKAKISVLDRGFLFADGVYEAIPIYNGKPFRGKQHLQRLARSLLGIKMPMPLSCEQWENVFKTLIKKNNIEQGNYNIYLQVTRGAAKTRRHAFPENVAPTVFAMASKSTHNLPYDVLCQGKSAITALDCRWQYCNIKSVSLLPNVLLSRQAKVANGCEAILIRDGYAIEGASSNLFIVKDGIIITPPLSSYILSGITREFILELAEQNNMLYREQQIAKAELEQADEIWISSSTREIYPITKLDGNNVGDGEVGPLWKKIIKLYRDAANKGDS